MTGEYNAASRWTTSCFGSNDLKAGDIGWDVARPQVHFRKLTATSIIRVIVGPTRDLLSCGPTRYNGLFGVNQLDTH